MSGTASRAVKWSEISSEDIAAISNLAAELHVHPLAIEDCIHRNQRPKLEDFGNHQFLVWFTILKGEICEIQFIIFPHHVIMVYHDKPPERDTWFDYFKLTDHRKDVWHLIYHALDGATDATWAEIRTLFSQVDDFEDRMFKEECDPQVLLNLKKRINRVEFSIGLLASVAEQLRNFCQSKDDLNWKLRDLHDHCERIDRSLELYRGQVTTTIELFWGHKANLTNRHIKKLTVLASISVPLTFWSSFWGMNFEAIPFHSAHLFAVALFLMALSVGGTFALLVKKGYWSD
jgi:magnesium transporter